MRVTEAVPNGRIVEVYNPGLFPEYEEVIVFAREEFNRTYSSIREQIDYINKVDMHLDRVEEWKLLGYWTKILERINILDINMNSMFKEEPVQCHLDSYLYDTIKSSEKKIAVSANKVSVQLKHSI
jgi:hypothetical protein